MSEPPGTPVSTRRPDQGVFDDDGRCHVDLVGRGRRSDQRIEIRAESHVGELGAQARLGGRGGVAVCGWGLSARVGDGARRRSRNDGRMAAQEPTPAVETAKRLLARLRAVERAPVPERVGVLEEIVAACRTGPPELAEEFWLPEVLEDLARGYGELGRLDEALATVQQAIDAGLKGAPDPRCVAAELAYRGGRPDLAERIWAQVRADTPGDWWLYNAVGLEKADAGEHEDAVAWFGAGLEVAMAAGDPDRVVGQLCDLRADSLAALGLPGDQMQDRAERYVADPSRPSVPERPIPIPMLPIASDVASDLFVQRAGHDPAPAVARLGFVWIPEGEYAAALTRWPVLAEDDGPAAGDDGHPISYRDYCRRLQERMVDLAGAASTGSRVELVVVPLRIARFAAWCEERGLEEASSGARAQFAADSARLEGPELVSWPPGRKQDCWCRSGRRYKRCCGGER